MKFKRRHLITLLLLVIFTMSAVSASEDIATQDDISSDELTVSEDTNVEDLTSEASDDSLASEPTVDDFDVKVNDPVFLEDDENAVIASYVVPEGANGIVKAAVYKDDEFYYDYENTVNDENKGITFNITTEDMDIYTETGLYNYIINYVPDEGNEITLSSGQLTVTKLVEKEDFTGSFGEFSDIYSKQDCVYYLSSIPIEGTLFIYTGAKKIYETEITDIDESVEIILQDLDIDQNGEYDISVKYTTTANQKFDLGSSKINVEVDWDEISDEYISINHCVYINFNSDDPDMAIGTIFDEDKIKGGTITILIDGEPYYTETVTDPYLTIYDLMVCELGLRNITIGTHEVKIVYMKNGIEEHFAQKSVDFYSMVKIDCPEEITVGANKNIAITLVKGANGTVSAYEIKDDDSRVLYKTVNINDGVAIIPLDSLPKGGHYFYLNFSSLFYENTGEEYYHVNVKDTADNPVTPVPTNKQTTNTANTQTTTKKTDKVKLILSTATVKKSAKKLVLKATLKKGNKVLSNKKITFKFNGKKYTAKTNKKGVAKVTIKKNILKKLKVGKKITYQAIYGKTTVKKTVKIKK